MSNRRNIFLWSLYDFANSIVLMAFLFYFSQWLVIEREMPAWWYNLALICSSILFVVSAPYISKRIDEGGNKIVGLRTWSALAFIGFLTISVMSVLVEGNELLITALYCLSNYAYLICFLYFTPMLNDLSGGQNRSWVSGIGQGANSLGQVVGVLITLPFVNGLTLFGDPGRAQALFPATMIFGLLILPLLFLYREDSVLASEQSKGTSFVKMLRDVFSYRPLALLLVAYFLFSDALLTFANNFPLYLEIVYGVSDTTKSILTAGILVLAAVGAVIFGKVANKKGELKTLKSIILIWCFLFALAVIIKEFILLIPVFLFAGILFGPVWAISRSLVGNLAPPHMLASSYSYYVVAERFATFIGPMVWSIVLVTMGEGARGYQFAMLSLGLIMLCSWFVLRRIRV